MLFTLCTPTSLLSLFLPICPSNTQGGHFSGVNRKVQIKPVRWASPPAPAAPVDDSITVPAGAVPSSSASDKELKSSVSFRGVPVLEEALLVVSVNCVCVKMFV